MNFNDATTWTTRDGRQVEIATMDREHARAARDHLLRGAVAFVEQELFKEVALFGDRQGCTRWPNLYDHPEELRIEIAVQTISDTPAFRALEKRARAERDPRPRTPMIERRLAIEATGRPRVVESFLGWLDANGFVIAEKNGDRLETPAETPEQISARYFGLDYWSLVDEQDALDAWRENND